MPSFCAVKYCGNTITNSKTRGIVFHRFPKDGERRQSWVAFCGQHDGWSPQQNQAICSSHFTSSSYDEGFRYRHETIGAKMRHQLLPKAIPTLKQTNNPSCREANGIVVSGKKKMYSCELCDLKFDELATLEYHKYDEHRNENDQGDKVIKMEVDDGDTIKTEESNLISPLFQNVLTTAECGEVCVQIHHAGDTSHVGPDSGNIPIKMEPLAEETELEHHQVESTIATSTFKQETDVNMSSNETIATTIQIKSEPVDINDAVSIENIEDGDNQQYQSRAPLDAAEPVANMPSEDKNTNIPQLIKPQKVPKLKVKCPHCFKNYLTGVIFDKHSQHCGPRDCEVCNLKFDKYHQYIYHMKKYHKEMKLTCPHCPKVFIEQSDFTKHTECCATRKFRCEFCALRFQRNIDLVTHKAALHKSEMVKAADLPKAPVSDEGKILLEDSSINIKTEITLEETALQEQDVKPEDPAISNEDPNPQQCSICELTLPNKIRLRSHILFTHTEPRFKCTRCPKTFFMRRTLLQHSQSHDEEYERERQRVSMADPNNIKECEICQIPFSNRQRLRHHMLTVHEEPKHKCAKCGKAFHYKGELNRHELVHAKNESGYLPPQEKKPKTVVEPASIPTCEQCNIQFLNKRIRHHHMVTVHSEPKFKCPYCPKVCYFLNTLERHQKTHSKIGAEKMCKTCGLQFETAAKKWRHMLNVHQIPRYRCPECADPFMYKRRLRRHMKHRHKKEIPVMSHGPYSMLSKNCSKCNLEFADMDEKRKHMQENHAELLVWCSQCPKAFGHKGSLQRHEQRVHGALPVRQVNAILEANALLQPNTVPDGPKGRNRTQWAKNCWECGLKFTTSTQSNAHMREKHQDRLFKCLECPSTFINERSLVLHNRSHNKVPRTVTEKTCSKCGVMFPTKSEKYKHMMEDHADSMYKCSQCPKLFVYKAKLEKHEKTPHDTMEEKPPQKLVAETIPDEKRKSHCEELITSSVLYECEQCNDQRLYEEDGYNQHIIEYHDEPPTEQVSIKCECTDCGDIFANHDLLLQHVEEAHRIIACRICAATFNDDKELDNHKITHHLEKCYSCPYCLETIPDVNTYKNHADLCSKQQYSCEICNTEFASLIFLEKHNRQVHPEDIRQSEDVVADNNDGEIIIDNIVPAHDEIKMEISVEEPTLQPVSHDQAHDDMLLVVSDVHEELHADNSSITDKEPHVTIDKKEYRRYNVGNRTVFECLICNATFDKFNAYRWHKIKTHIGKTLICPHCGKSLWKLNDFQNHIAKCAIKKFPCEFCNRRFPTKEAVEVHIKERHKLQVQQMIGLPMVTMPNVDCKCECTVCGDISENRELHFGHMKANHGHKVMCDYCTLTFTDDDELASHTKSDHNQASQKCYECTLCGIMFSSQQRYNMHKQVIHQRIQHKCSKCLQQFYKTHTFLEHKAQCVGRILSCKFCDAKFSTDKALRKHLQRNHKVVEQASEPNIIQSIISECPICGEVFSDGFQLSKHVQESHQKTVCTICSKTFDNDAELFSHKLTTHPDPASDAFQCPHCAKHFRSSALLESHQESCGPRCLRECNICHKKYVKLSRLIEHTSSCHPEMIFSCRFCPRKFIEEAALLRHADYCAERIYSCSQCDASRKTLDEFKRHVALTGHAAEPVIAPENTQSAESDSPSYPCLHCTKQFDKSDLLKRHVRECVPRECYICNQTFTAYAKYSTHMLTNHPKLVHNCPFCPRKFFDEDVFHRHTGYCATRKYSCCECDATRMTSGGFRSHVARTGHADTPVIDCGEARRELQLPCPICKAVFRSISSQQYHMTIAHREPHIKCPKCDEVFHFQRRMRNHLASHDGTPVDQKMERKRPKVMRWEYPCQKCSAVFYTNKELMHHKFTMHKPPSRKCAKCPECSKVFDRKSRLIDHMSRHHGGEPRKLPPNKRSCNDCNVEFNSIGAFKYHMAKIHGEHRFNCPVCSKAFHLKAKMLLHLRTHEKNKLKLIIIPADVPFPTCGAEVKPMQAEGLLEKPKTPENRSCTYCNIEFNTIAKWKYHMLKFHREPRFKCPICAKTFHYKHSGKAHLNKHGTTELEKIQLEEIIPKPRRLPKAKIEPRFKCPKCEKPFYFQSKLDRHLRNHVKFDRKQNGLTTTEPRFKCPKCEKPCKFKSELKRHLESHAKQELKPKIQKRPLPAEKQSCTKCNVEFNSYGAWYYHLTHFHREFRFKCPLCMKGFQYESYLKTHLRNHEKNKQKKEPEEIIPADVPSPISDNEIEPTEAESLYASA